MKTHEVTYLNAYLLIYTCLPVFYLFFQFFKCCGVRCCSVGLQYLDIPFVMSDKKKCHLKKKAAEHTHRSMVLSSFLPLPHLGSSSCTFPSSGLWRWAWWQMAAAIGELNKDGYKNVFRWIKMNALKFYIRWQQNQGVKDIEKHEGSCYVME